MKFNDTVTRIENIIRNVVYIRRIGKLVLGYVKIVIISFIIGSKLRA